MVILPIGSFMQRLVILPVCLLALAACDPTAFISQSSRADQPEISCLTQPQGGCTFNQAPLRVLNEPVELPKRPYVFFPTAEPLNFVDAQGVGWNAPARTLTDGASIPKIFVAIVGDPTSPEYINAAAVHDAYCGIGNEAGSAYHQAKWEDVHVMFYDGLIVGGTAEIRAKIMFAAVWLGGPRWKEPSGAVVSTQGMLEAEDFGYVNPMDRVSDARKQAAMRKAKIYIETQQPPLPQLIRYLRQLERDMLQATYSLSEDMDEPANGYGNEEYYYEYPGGSLGSTGDL
jgi:hypothetical protein